MALMFSIIVPVYNVKEYLSVCLDSLVNQKDISDYEVIVVDDGSTDGSEAICDDYSQKYDFIHAYHKMNGGLSDARNYGVKYANGEYILFIDSDDYISDNALQECRDKIVAEKAHGHCVDVVIAEGQYFDTNNVVHCERWFNKELANGTGVVSGEQMLKYTLSVRCNWAAWGKFFRREFWCDHGYAFKFRRLSEDMQIIDRIVLEADSVCMISPFVYYRYRVGSIANVINLAGIISILDNLTDWENYFDLNSTIDNDIKKGITRNLASSFLHTAVAKVYNLKGDDFDIAMNAIIDKKKWFGEIGGMEGVIANSLKVLFGVKSACRILTKIKNIRRRRSIA